jgi:methylenetetrahydrofolate dehydrogenase (NADP+) / methenyltetrahydrofolate cyclohydrolase
MILIDGKKVAAEMKQEIAAKVAELKRMAVKAPHLAAVLVGMTEEVKPMLPIKLKIAKK